MSDLYQVLGVPRTAELDDIKRSYRRLVRTCHPDINPSPQAAQTFKSVSRAYTVLSDPGQRALYDQYGARMLEPGFDPTANGGWTVRPPNNGENDSPFGDMSAFRDVWSSILNGELPEEPEEDAQAPTDLEVEAQIDAYTAARGGVTQISFRTATGRVKQVRVRVRAGAQDGEVVRMPGMAGGAGMPGDLLVTLRIPQARAHTPRGQSWARPPAGRDAYHRGAPGVRGGTAAPAQAQRPRPQAPPPQVDSRAEREFATAGAEVMELDVPVTVMEAVRGGVIDIQTPIGRRRVNIPPRCGGRTLRIRTRSRTGRVADTTIVLKLQIVLPADLDAEALHALELLERSYRRPLPR